MTPKSWALKLWKSQRAILALVVVVNAGHALGVWRTAEAVEQDLLVASERPRVPEHTYVVGFTDEDIAAGSTPRSQIEIQRVLTDIAKGSPKAIAVDIDSTGFSDDLPKAVERVPIIWLYGARPCTPPADDQCPAQLGPADDCIKADAPFGGRPLPTAHRSALALSDRAFDGIVRTYRRIFKTDSPTMQRHLATVARETIMGEASSLESGDPEWIRFRSSCEVIPFSSVGDVRSMASSGTMIFPWFKKIVIVGGTYVGNNDVARTPIGAMYGAQVLANIVETELGDEVKHISWLSIAAEIVLGNLFLLVLHRLGPTGTFWTGLILSALAGVASIVLYLRFGIALGATVLIVGLWLKRIWHHLQHQTGVEAIRHAETR